MNHLNDFIVMYYSDVFRRTTSAPGGLDENEDMLIIYQDFDATMEEVS